MTIDTSLDTLMLPALPTYKNEFGTKRLNGGLTTAECTDGVMIWGRRQRPFPVTETSETTKVEAHCTFEVTTAGIELTIADATFAGCEAKVINASDGPINVKGGVSGLNGSSNAVTIPPRAMLFFTFFEGWITSNSTYSGNNEVSDFEKRIFLASHPPTTLYWTSDPRNPGYVYGGTWKQIKDRFILAAGDTYTNGATGGNANTTLTEANLPSHTHGLNNHTHSFTPRGNISVSTNPTFTGTAVTSAGMSQNSSGYAGVGDRYGNGSARATSPFSYRYYQDGSSMQFGPSSNADSTSLYMDISHTHSVTAEGLISGGAYSFSGTAGTTDTASGNTTATGSGTAFSNMPPYAVKYCWERTA